MLALRQLEYLVTVLDTGSFTRAAERLHVTQPALSHQVRALERQIGGPLLERLPRGVRLTPMGRAMVAHARAALAEVDRATQAAREAGGLVCGELEVATIYSVSLGVLPAGLRTWRRMHPDVSVRMHEYRHADELLAAMVAGRADVAVGPVPTAWDGPVRELGREEFVVVLPSDDPAAGRDDARIDLRELADRSWVHYAPGHGLADVLNQACALVGFTPRAAVRTEQTATAPVLAAAGLGPTLTPSNVIPASFDGALRWPDPPVTRMLAAYTRAHPDTLTSAFVETIAEHARCAPVTSRPARTSR